MTECSLNRPSSTNFNSSLTPSILPKYNIDLIQLISFFIIIITQIYRKMEIKFRLFFSKIRGYVQHTWFFL